MILNPVQGIFLQQVWRGDLRVWNVFYKDFSGEEPCCFHLRTFDSFMEAWAYAVDTKDDDDIAYWNAQFYADEKPWED